MGKKTQSKTSSSASTPANVSSSESSAHAKKGSSSTAAAAKVEGFQAKELLSSISEDIAASLAILENLSKPNKSFSKSEIESMLTRLESGYVKVAVKNRVTRKQEEALVQEISDLSAKREVACNEMVKVREDFFQAESKVDKLDGLSKMLSHRLKAIETKASEDVKFEKEERLKLSYEFSGKIKDISTKLDELSKRRESIVSENIRLRQILKACLEELDKEDELEAAKATDGKTDVPAAVAEADTDVERDVEEKESRARELKNMAMEDDIAKIVALKAEEEKLRLESSLFMEVFDSFQLRLTDSNQQFRTKQSKVDELTKEIQRMEKANRDASTHNSECTLSAKTTNENVARIRGERERLVKMMEKQRALTDRFQNEITSLENSLY